MSNKLIDNKELMQEYDYEKNKNIDLNKFYLFSHTKIWWKCKYGHSWNAVAYTRAKGSGCPYCTGQKAIIGVNDLKTKCPELLKEWDYKLNINLKPETFTYKSGKKVNWICEYGHRWVASINNRSKGSGCPYCSGNKTILGKNDLKTIRPDIIKDWDYKKSKNINIDEISIKSGRKIWWLCSKCGYSWNATVSHRSAGYNNCPHCNSLSIKNPLVAKDWDYELNKYLKFSPDNISPFSSKKVWWSCSRCGKQWKTSISNRSNGSGCPNCNSQTSFPEQAIYYYIKKTFDDALNRYLLKGIEIDIYIPSKKIGIEYDGIYYHNNKLTKENIKDEFCINNDILLYRIREFGLEETQSAFNIFRSNNSYEDLNKCINILFQKIKINSILEINCKKDELNIISQYTKAIKENSFGTKHGELLNEWDYELNKGIDPFSVSEYSKILINWKCPNCNNKWRASISMRSRGKKKCQVCNSVQLKSPQLLKEWNYIKNNKLGIMPNKISFSSPIKA